MRKFLTIMIMIIIPVLVFAQDFTEINLRVDIEKGIISGKNGDKNISFPLAKASFNDGHTFVFYNDLITIDDAKPVRLNIDLPDGFVAIAESDRAKNDGNRYTFELDNHDDRLVLAFSDRWTIRTEEYKGVEIATYFNSQNAPMSGKYIERLRELLDIYTSILGDYPYGRFAVADVPYPVGHALTGLTFISERIIPMPFLTDVSLGHELLHQWFGVAIDVDHADGNWAEGITTYMADRLYAEMKGEGVEYRKNALLSHMAHSRQKEDGTCLLEFKYNKDATAQAIGYSRAMLIFSMYETMLGEEKFEEALKTIVTKYKYKKASWHDFRKVFDSFSGVDSENFLDGWLAEMAMGEFSVSKVKMQAVADGYETSFTINNKYDWHDYPLDVRVKTRDGEVREYIYVSKGKKDFTIKSDALPVELIIDPEYRMPRMLTLNEMRPNMYNLFSKYEKVIFVKDSDMETYAPLEKMLENAKIVSDSENPYRYKDKILIFAGGGNLAHSKMYGVKTPYSKSIFKIEAKNHTSDITRMSYVINSTSTEALSKNIRRASHYGKYSKVELGKRGRFIKNIKNSVNGIRFKLYEERQGTMVRMPLTIKEIINQNEDIEVFHIGELHTNYAHHQNQLELIRQLRKLGRDVAIGMEMIQKPFQKVVDDYIAERISEGEMLDKTEYFKRWKYDYRLYRDIFRYAREHKTPIVALNLQQEITKKISKKGIDTLPAEDIKEIPESIDFVDGRYKNDLKKIFDLHAQAMGFEFENFYAAQTLWDETMADSAHKFLKDNPEKTIVIIAGNGHIKYRDSIPERLKRRNGKPYVSIVQGEAYEEGIADYILNPTDIEYEKTPKMGVHLDENEKGLEVKKVTEKSFAKDAGIKEGDFIISFNGRKIERLVHLKTSLIESEMGRVYDFKVRRDGEEIPLKIEFKRD